MRHSADLILPCDYYKVLDTQDVEDAEQTLDLDDPVYLRALLKMLMLDHLESLFVDN